MFRIALAAAAMTATPALATERAHAPQQVHAALKAGCSVQAVHTPAGKTVQQPAIVQCPRERVETAAQTRTDRSAKRVAVD